MTQLGLYRIPVIQFRFDLVWSTVDNKLTLLNKKNDKTGVDTRL